MTWKVATGLQTISPRGSLGPKIRRALGRAVKGSPAQLRNLLSRTGAPSVDPGSSTADDGIDTVWTTPPVPLPDAVSYADIETLFRTWSVNREPVGHLDVYVDDSIQRFLHTWGMVRSDRGRCLELGANPYFTTYLLDSYTDLDLTLANYYGSSGETTETVSYLPRGANSRVEVEYRSHMFNVEEELFPFESAQFDVVLFCEMIEHLLMSPLATLNEIRRVLQPGGILVLTTPNVARLANVLAMVNGANIYDPYSGYGPYGRHNREYIRHELHRLLEFAGFEVEYSFTADGHDWNVFDWPRHTGVAPLVSFRSPDLGQYLFVRARLAGPARAGLPSFLYRSWPAERVVEYR